MFSFPSRMDNKVWSYNLVLVGAVKKVINVSISVCFSLLYMTQQTIESDKTFANNSDEDTFNTVAQSLNYRGTLIPKE